MHSEHPSSSQQKGYPIPIHLPELEATIAAVRRPEVVRPLRTLRANLVDAGMLVESPAFWAIEAMLAVALSESLRNLASGPFEPWSKAVAALESQLRENPSPMSLLYPHAQGLVEGIGRQPDVERQLQILLQSALVRTWAALEAFSSDLWQDILDEPTLFRRVVDLDRVLETKPDREPEGLTNKAISFQSIMRHDFNLQGKMGTILREKFDFTSVKGINKAYAAAFKAEPSPQLSAGRELRKIELTRHVIVHRAGKPDDKFRSQFNVGTTLLVLTKPEVMAWIRLVGTECAHLAKRLDDIVTSVVGSQ